MLLTATQVIAIELAILIIYFCYKETQRCNITTRQKGHWKLSEHKNQEARLPKQNKKWTEGLKRKNEPEIYHFEKMGLRTKSKSYPFE